MRLQPRLAALQDEMLTILLRPGTWMTTESGSSVDCGKYNHRSVGGGQRLLLTNNRQLLHVSLEAEAGRIDSRRVQEWSCVCTCFW